MWFLGCTLVVEMCVVFGLYGSCRHVLYFCSCALVVNMCVVFAFYRTVGRFSDSYECSFWGCALLVDRCVVF